MDTSKINHINLLHLNMLAALGATSRSRRRYQKEYRNSRRILLWIFRWFRPSEWQQITNWEEKRNRREKVAKMLLLSITLRRWSCLKTFGNHSPNCEEQPVNELLILWSRLKAFQVHERYESMPSSFGFPIWIFTWRFCSWKFWQFWSILE